MIYKEYAVKSRSSVHFLVLDLFQNVWVINMVFDWVCNWIMSLHIIVIEERPSSPSYLLIFYLLHHVISVVLPFLFLLHHFLLHRYSVSQILLSHSHLLFLFFCHLFVFLFFLFSKLVCKGGPHVG